MTTTPRRRQVKPTTGYKIPPDIRKDFDELIDDGEFVSYADMITASARLWLAFRRFDVKAACREYLLSDEGRELIRNTVREKRK